MKQAAAVLGIAAALSGCAASVVTAGRDTVVLQHEWTDAAGGPDDIARERASAHCRQFGEAAQHVSTVNIQPHAPRILYVFHSTFRCVKT